MEWWIIAVVLMGGALGVVRMAEAGVEAAPPYVDRIHWFQLRTPWPWQMTGGSRRGEEVLTATWPGFPSVAVSLKIRPLAELPELVAREQLIGQAEDVLRMFTSDPIHEITGWPLAGAWSDGVASAGMCRRVVVLMDAPRRRAFVWVAVAPARIFPQFDVAFDQLALGLVPTLPEE